MCDLWGYCLVWFGWLWISFVCKWLEEVGVEVVWVVFGFLVVFGVFVLCELVLGGEVGLGWLVVRKEIREGVDLGFGERMERI